jgi:hypothetical protein
MRLLVALTLIFLSFSMLHQTATVHQASKVITLASLFPKSNAKALATIFKYISKHKT